MNITNLPKKERPREKLIQYGATVLSDSELLAIILGHGYQHKSSIDLARDLLNKYKGLRKLAAISFREIIKLPGLGPAKYCQLHAAMEISKRALQECLLRDLTITDTSVARKFIHAKLRDFDHEVFACLFLDSHHRVIEFETLAHGGMHATSINPRQVLKRILHHNATAIIIAHNHPSGIATPSETDIETTLDLQKSLALFEVTLLDHFVIGDNTVISLANHGVLTP